MTLCQIEEAFRNLKCDLSLRPVFHQKDTRIEAHIFISFLAYCLHVTSRRLELPAKMVYPASLYMTLHRTLYVAFGPPGPGPFIEIGAILAAAVLVFLVRRHRPAFWLTLLGAVFLAAGLALYFAFIEPANVEMKDWTLAAPPSDWMSWRDQWEYGHAAHFVLNLLGFAALVLSLIVGKAANRSNDHEPVS